MLTAQEAMDAYVSACNTTDPETRRRLIEQSMTEDAKFAYPTVETRGWEGISAAIAAMQQQVPGICLVQTSGIEEHHGWFRVAWRMLAADGSALGEGIDVAEVAEDGRISRVIGFREPPPPLSQSR